VVVAKLSRANRKRMAELLVERLPPHWSVTTDAAEYAFVEADQDGDRPESRFPQLGTTVLAATNGPSTVVVTAFERVKCPAGYPEARKPTSTVCEFSGRGWMEKTVQAMVDHAVEVDKKRPDPVSF